MELRPRLFHSLKASGATELARENPIHLVTAWLGNRPKIAMKYYLMTAGDDVSSSSPVLQGQRQVGGSGGANSGAA
jgi:hypothetical protein